ncbi:hypothetical protein PAQ31011_05097 [Pandoraea aquatica]|uniref:Uncharacterized protein n=1 Tax=Pandoraea aquatica TaxID=2508290 RepID=A0A5E4Z6D2_9BURK|nr:hypothetical protein [Pandoraea aquatica]VVE56308.1 hypothetical protein PAQ31011_05097 [Pandoraea aquatica]
MDKKNQKQSQRDALNMLLGLIDFKKKFPENVFRGKWGGVLFFESDAMFSTEFAEVVSGLLRYEGANAASLVNIDEAKSLGFENVSALFLDGEVTGDLYQSFLIGAGPAKGWLYNVDSYACASDVGGWCIYCEKSNDIGVIASREPITSLAGQQALRLLGARPIETLIAGGGSALFPFNRLVDSWREGLMQNYAVTRAD